MNRADADDPAGLRYVAGIDRQAGALAWLPGTDPVRFVLVTTRRTGRWAFPKGSVARGASLVETAAREALEEAGVRGTVDPVPLGIYRQPKIRPPLIWTIEVVLFALRVDEMLDSWPEIKERRRRLVTLDEARALIGPGEMLALAERYLGER